jgi:hypothetical protein
MKGVSPIVAIMRCGGPEAALVDDDRLKALLERGDLVGPFGVSAAATVQKNDRPASSVDLVEQVYAIQLRYRHSVAPIRLDRRRAS